MYEWEKELDEYYLEWGDMANRKIFLWRHILGGCDCGSIYNEDISWRVFRSFALGTGIDGIVEELLAHWLHSKGLTDHSSNITDSWFSEEGRYLYDTLIKKDSGILTRRRKQR